MNVQDYRLVSVEQYYDTFGINEDIDLIQLSPGPLDFRMTVVDLQGILLYWNQVGARIRSRELYRGSAVQFGFVLQSPASVNICGHESDWGEAIFWQCNQEVEYIAPTGLTALVIYVDSVLVNSLGWTLAGDAVQRVPRSRLSKLAQTCQLATHAARRQFSADIAVSASTQSPLETDRWRNRIMADLELALVPWLTAPSPCPWNTAPSPRKSVHSLFREAERVLARHDLGHFATVDEFAKEIRVPPRTLFHAFHELVGTGPYAYLQLVKLHKLRELLLVKSSTETTISTLASRLGFRHLGRMSVAYREHFGESPSDTLRRR